MQVRLQKIISRYGLASRRKAEQWITDGRVLVNGKRAELGDTADEAVDKIVCCGQPLAERPALCYLMLNKPRGYVTTLKDEFSRKNVSELVTDCGAHVYPIGRLDMDSEGLLLLTNDGTLAHQIMHPRHIVSKVYHVWVSDFSPELLQKLSMPIVIDGYRTSPAEVQLLEQKERKAKLQFTIHEGRNRQIRRICQSAGLRVTRLKRIQEGPVKLGDLPVGKWRFLTKEELCSLQDD